MIKSRRLLKMNSLVDMISIRPLATLLLLLLLLPPNAASHPLSGGAVGLMAPPSMTAAEADLHRSALALAGFTNLSIFVRGGGGGIPGATALPAVGEAAVRILRTHQLAYALIFGESPYFSALSRRHRLAKRQILIDGRAAAAAAAAAHDAGVPGDTLLGPFSTRLHPYDMHARTKHMWHAAGRREVRHFPLSAATLGPLLVEGAATRAARADRDRTRVKGRVGSGSGSSSMAGKSAGDDDLWSGGGFSQEYLGFPPTQRIFLCGHGIGISSAASATPTRKPTSTTSTHTASAENSEEDSARIAEGSFLAVVAEIIAASPNNTVVFLDADGSTQHDGHLLSPSFAAAVRGGVLRHLKRRWKASRKARSSRGGNVQGNDKGNGQVKVSPPTPPTPPTRGQVYRQLVFIRHHGVSPLNAHYQANSQAHRGNGADDGSPTFTAAASTSPK